MLDTRVKAPNPGESFQCSPGNKSPESQTFVYSPILLAASAVVAKGFWDFLGGIRSLGL